MPGCQGASSRFRDHAPNHLLQQSLQCITACVQRTCSRVRVVFLFPPSPPLPLIPSQNLHKRASEPSINHPSVPPPPRTSPRPSRQGKRNKATKSGRFLAPPPNRSKPLTHLRTYALTTAQINFLPFLTLFPPFSLFLFLPPGESEVSKREPPPPHV